MSDAKLNKFWGDTAKFRTNATGGVTGVLGPESSDLAFGVGLPEAIATGRALTAEDNGTTFVCSSTPAFSAPVGLQVGFTAKFKGACTFTGDNITDVRTTGATNPWCDLVQTGTDTYDVVGTAPTP